jgi:MATE family multidrug resistance protein
LFFVLPLLFSARVSNALGAGCPQAARLSVYAAMTLAVFEAILVSSTIFTSRRVLGYIFSNEQDVVDYVTDMVPLISLSVIMDSLHGTLSGWPFFLEYFVFMKLMVTE